MTLNNHFSLQESAEDANKKVEALLEKFIEVYETKNNTKADEEMRRNLITMLKQSLRLDTDDAPREPPRQCRECGKNLEESEDSDLSSFCCNPIEADQTSSKFSIDPDALLVAPKIGMQTVALRNKIENLQKRLVNLQSRCDLDERKLDRKGGSRSRCQSFSNKDEANKECTCSGQMEILKERLNFITNKLQSLEKSTLLNSTAASPTNGRVINYPIVLEEPTDKPKSIDKPKPSGRVSKIQPKVMQASQSSEKKTNVRSRTERTEVERKTVVKDQRASPGDSVIEKGMEGENRVTKYRSGLSIIEKPE